MNIFELAMLRNRSGGAPADWNQSDENGPGYVKNRTHYTEEVAGPFFEATFNTVADPNGVGQYEGSFYDYPYIREDGTKYLVTFDGVDYLCEVAVASMGRMIGNYDLMKSGAGWPECHPYLYQAPTTPADTPFALIWSNYYTPRFHVYAREPGEHTFVVRELVTIVRPLDEKFIPNSIARSADIMPVHFGRCTTSASSLNKSVNTLYALTQFTELKEGAAVIVYFLNKNTATGSLTLNVNSFGAKPIYIKESTSISSADAGKLYGPVLCVYWGGMWLPCIAP